MKKLIAVILTFSLMTGSSARADFWGGDRVPRNARV